MKNRQNLMKKCGRKIKRLESVDIVDKKTFQPRLRIEKEKPKIYDKRKNLVEEGLGWNKVLFSSQWGQIANG